MTLDGLVTKAVTIILLILVESVFIKVSLVLLRWTGESINERQFFGAWLLTLILLLSGVIVFALANVLWGVIA